jgi:hypothetical protein
LYVNVDVALFVDDLLMLMLMLFTICFIQHIVGIVYVKLFYAEPLLQQPTSATVDANLSISISTDLSVSTISCGIVPAPGTERACKTTLHAPRSTLNHS